MPPPDQDREANASAAPATGRASGTPRVERGSCHALFVFDIGHGIDLARCAGEFQTPAQRKLLLHTHAAPAWFQFQLPPLRVVQEAESVALGRWRTSATVELVLYDFGAVSVGYEIALDAPLEDWIELGCTLFESRVLPEAAERLVRALAAQLGDLVTKPGVAAVSDDYALFVLGDLAPGESESDVLARHGHELARLLRSERGRLSEQEQQDALSNRVSFGEHDLAIIDWNGALLFDDEPDDVRSVLELANVQLLELRFLDRQLDQSLDRAYETLGRRTWRRIWAPAALERDLQRVSAMQVDAAILFERVGNALKLLNDQYLARVYRQASQRLRLAEWNSGLLRKLETLEGIYQKLQDRADARRMEFLEWVIIALILAEIALSIARG